MKNSNYLNSTSILSFFMLMVIFNITVGCRTNNTSQNRDFDTDHLSYSFDEDSETYTITTLDSNQVTCNKIFEINLMNDELESKSRSNGSLREDEFYIISSVDPITLDETYGLIRSGRLVVQGYSKILPAPRNDQYLEEIFIVKDQSWGLYVKDQYIPNQFDTIISVSYANGRGDIRYQHGIQDFREWNIRSLEIDGKTYLTLPGHLEEARNIQTKYLGNQEYMIYQNHDYASCYFFSSGIHKKFDCDKISPTSLDGYYIVAKDNNINILNPNDEMILEWSDWNIKDHNRSLCLNDKSNTGFIYSDELGFELSIVANQDLGYRLIHPVQRNYFIVQDLETNLYGYGKLNISRTYLSDIVPMKYTKYSIGKETDYIELYNSDGNGSKFHKFTGENLGLAIM